MALMALAAFTLHSAAAEWRPEKNVEFVIPTSPGGGQDRTARVIQKIMQDGGLVPTPVVVVNKPGGGGNIAYTYISQFAGDGHYLATASPTLLTNHILGLSPLSYTGFSAVSVLYNEYIGFAVNAEGPIKNGRDLVERVKSSPESVTFAFGTSRGNANHIGVALAMKAAGVDVSKLKVVIYKSSIDATTALMGGHVDAVATPTSTYLPVLASGKIRIIAVAAPQRVAGRFTGVATWKEQGFNVVMPSYRMIIAPRGWSTAQAAFWDGVFARLSQSDAWKQELAANEWEGSYMNSADSRRYLDARYDEYRKILAELGLVK
ncbi:MAG: tripartite tricarboxylate transporter substrate binding protein [Betaproteobacteria bacterium]|nr:tripartite tricarboxylate transporter substrate binding protein [Betaproteobacteria bacterium]